ncbi:MAG: CarD family transcriptional regulator, partial [Oscillospiraceae bacterium]
KSDKEYKIDDIVKFLVKTGYTCCDQVEGKCQFAKRGGIIDIFPPNLKNPVRVEFWGDDIDSLSYFEVDTQRRTDALKSFTITPAREVLINEPQKLIKKLEQIKQSLRGKFAAEQRETIDTDIENISENIAINNQDKFIKLLYGNNSIFDYFKDEVFVLSSPTEAKEAIKNVLWQNGEDIKILLEDKVLYSGLDGFYLDFTDVASVFTKSKSIIFDTFGRNAEGIPLRHIYDIKSLRLSSWSGEYSILKEDLDDYKSSGYCVLIYGGTEKNAKNLVSDLQRDGFSADYVDDFSEIVPKKIYVTSGSISGGFDYSQIKFAVISINKSGGGLTAKKPKRAGKNGIKSLSDLSVGDYVVHVSHGIGVFSGIVKREIHGITKDYIKIRYAGTDELFVPVTQLDLVTKYIGTKEDGTVKLNKLNSAEWQKTRQRVKKAVADMADELIKLYAERLSAKGFAFSPDTDWQNDFEGRFPYEETDDQLRCIREIKDDMESGMPMDRLLCGDVGFGKTEVALRAAFKCVMDSKQCAVLVPTTILAWQHYKTFTQRMEGFPVKIELLSRFRTPKQQEEIIKELKRGD